MKAARSPDEVPDAFEVAELRRYALRPHARDTLIALFEREFIETQEACGTAPFGHFRDLDDPDAFVWLRGFPEFEKRSEALAAFYGSRCWAAHREAANATMVHSDNVLLLRDARAGSGFDLSGLDRPALDRDDSPPEMVVAATVFMLEHAASEEILAAFEQALLPALRACAERVAYLVTDERPNAFPRLPVREGEFALVAAGVCATPAAVVAWQRSLEEPRLPQALRSALKGIENLRLQPARRSRFR